MAEMQAAGSENGDYAMHNPKAIKHDEALCTTEADEYFLGIKGELSQVDRLVSDAVSNLVISFEYISKLINYHHDMVLAIEKMSVPEGSKPILELLEKQMVVADKIAHELEMTITSLQFGDLVTQLLAHTVNQVEALSLELQHIDRKRNWEVSADKNEFDAIQDGISKAIEIAKGKSKLKPVVQQEMKMGDIELF